MAHFKVPCNGWIVHAIPFLLTLTAFILAAVGTRSCRFLSSQNEVLGRRYFGIFQYDVGPNSPCVNVNFREYLYTFAPQGLPESFEASQQDFHIAQVGAIMATVFGAFVSIVLFLSFFKRLPPRCFKYFNCFWLLWGVVGCGMTFRLFKIYWCGEGAFFDTEAGVFRDIEGECYMEGGGIRMAAAGGLYLVAAMVLCCMEAPDVAMLEFSRSYEAVPTSIDAEQEVEMIPNSVEIQKPKENGEVGEKENNVDGIRNAVSLGSGQASQDDV